MIGTVKWFALMTPANDNEGGDGKRAVAQQYFWWPSNLYPRA